MERLVTVDEKSLRQFVKSAMSKHQMWYWEDAAGAFALGAEVYVPSKDDGYLTEGE
jgi:hypothetical protein